MRHGPHHAAQKSTTTGTDAFSVAESKSVASTTSIGALTNGRPAWHFPHLLALSSLLNRTRFLVAQYGQSINTPLLSSCIRCSLVC
jgi:hypothetical protein